MIMKPFLFSLQKNRIMGTVKFDNFKEYIVYLYFHVAYADGKIQSQEKTMILKNMGKLFPNEKNLESLFEAWHSNYTNSINNTEEIIKQGNQQFSDIEFHKKYKIFIQLYEIIGADGVIEASETESIEKLKKIINMEIED